MCVLSPSAMAASATSQLGTVDTSASALNVRSARSTSASVLTSIPRGSYLTLMWQSGSWWYVEYADEKFGYCHADYINTVWSRPKKVTLSSGTLNVRAGAGTSYARIDALKNGDIVLVVSTAGTWSKIVYSGTKVGYVSSKFLSVPQSYTAISLNVPLYKQSDSRWAGVKLGSSGKTMSKIGCATTGIAMMESYKTGTAIYPNAMAKKLSYTSSGNVYWPDDYTAVTSSSGYLSGIYNKLKEGKPVLFGAKNSYGSQHWVVVTGYTGGSTLTPAGFKINDPASSSRTTLQDLLDTHPNFYKYFYY